MSIQRQRVLGIAILLLPLLFVHSSLRAGGREDTKFRWDIITTSSTATFNILPGGKASAKAENNAEITLTGRGTFVLGDPDEVTGGGTWKIGSKSGTYRVRRLIRFDLAPGSLSGVNDTIGNEANARAGLAIFSIAYSDGSRGILLIGCSLDDTPASVFEGVIATKGFVAFWNHGVAAPDFSVNATLFHIVPEAED